MATVQALLRIKHYEAQLVELLEREQVAREETEQALKVAEANRLYLDLTGLGSLSQGAAFSNEAGGALDAEPGDPSFGPSFRGTLSYPMSIPKPIIGAINGPCFGSA